VSNEIDLADLIFQIKSELLARRPAEKAKGLPALFWIDQVELELSVSITTQTGGKIKISVIPVDAEVTGIRGKQQGHTVKVRLTPLLPLEEMRSLLLKDPEARQALEEFSRIALARGRDANASS